MKAAKLLVTAIVLVFLVWMAESRLGADEKQCHLTLNSISRSWGYPGSVFRMYGVFGDEQGAKMPAIGSLNEDGDQDAPLIVIFWSNTMLVVRVPSHLHPGPYKVGVFCSDPCKPGAVTTIGMVWRNFQVVEVPRYRVRKKI